MTTTIEAARTYLKCGFMPLPVKNGKNPDFTGWQNFHVEEREIEKKFSSAKNIGLLLGEPSGDLVDVDLDCIEALRLAADFLPKTDMRGGRKQSPNSHYFYKCADVKTTKYLDPDVSPQDKRAMLVELRSTGTQTLVFPSKHPSGDFYEWNGEGLEPRHVPQKSLEKSVRRLAACALIARHWKDGRRHELALALSGGLLRAEWSEEEVREFIRAAATTAGDNEINDRLKAVSTTASNLKNNGKATTGIPTLVSIVGDRVVSKLTDWLELRREPQARVYEEETPDHRVLDFVTHHTDEGNAQRLVQLHGDSLRWVHEHNRWFVFDKRWKADDAQARVLALDVVRRLYHQAAGENLDKEDRANLFKFALRTENERGHRSMLEMAKKWLTVQISDFDKDPWLFNCANGTLHLKTGEFREHRREDMLTCISPTEWTGNEDCNRFTEFLEEVFQGDYEVINFVRRAAGLSLVGKVFERILLFCWGSGHNGKSTLLEILADVMGPDYAGAASPDLLMDADYSQQAHELASLRPLRLVTAIETSEGRRMAESRVKQITGRDRVKACMKYGHPFEFTPKFTVWLATNHKPIIRGTDDAIWHRLSGLIPFQAKFTGENDDRQLGTKLQKEAPGILAWAVRGLTEYIETGLGTASKIEEEVAKYRSESDPLADFLAGRCILAPEHSIRGSALYEAYLEWCKDAGSEPLNQTAFGRRLNEKGIYSQKVGVHKFRIGVDLERSNL